MDSICFIMDSKMEKKLNKLKSIYATLKNGGTFRWLKGNKILHGDILWLESIIQWLETKGYTTYGGSINIDIILDKCKLPHGGYGSYTAVFLSEDIRKQYDMSVGRRI